ncbi:hypothetical protein C8J57DRAFT_1732725 [Mycena rebaudengoi]|nr:hypothetical protein C8J57DRAFT_1732725 [Mycena rebaudengoi]
MLCNMSLQKMGPDAALGPSTSICGFTPNASETRMAKRKTMDPNAKVDRDEAVRQCEKSLGGLRPMVPTQLTHELFQSAGHRDLLCVASTSPYRLHGLPTKLFLEFRMLSKPFSLLSSLVLNGRPGTGNSFLLQTAEYAEATGGSCSTSRVDATLQRFATVNAPHLDLLTTRAPARPSRAPPPPLAPAVLEQLAAQSRFPVLIAIDDFQALYGRSLYRDPFFHFVRPHHLSIPRLLEYASGRRTFTRGLVLDALTRSNPQFPVPP